MAGHRVLAGFAVKVPMIPFHTWLPAAYAEAPSPVDDAANRRNVEDGHLRVCCALRFLSSGIRLRRFARRCLCWPWRTWSWAHGRGGAERSEARLRLHVGKPPGLLLLGIFALRSRLRGCRDHQSGAALNGVIFQMFSHGITAAALFWFVAMMQERTGGHRGIGQFGGLRKPAPVLAGLMGIALFSSLGLPGLNAFPANSSSSAASSAGLVAATVSVLGCCHSGRNSDCDSKSFHRPRAGALRRLS